MSQKTIARLERLQQLNSKKEWINHDLYRLMYREDLYIIAYERIKSKPGNMTPGTDEETLDGFSRAEILEIIEEMKTEQFRFRPVRQQFIPKPNGKMRKLGIPCVRDKIVQEVIRLILEAIYDSPQSPYFEDASHGFRPHRSCHTALREIRTHWTAVNWYIEGDIRACFDELDHRLRVGLHGARAVIEIRNRVDREGAVRSGAAVVKSIPVREGRSAAARERPEPSDVITVVLPCFEPSIYRSPDLTTSRLWCLPPCAW